MQHPPRCDQVGYVRHRHVEGQLQAFIPVRSSVKYSGTKTLSLVLSCISIDDRRSSDELFFIVKQAPIVIQVLYVHLIPTISDRIDEVGGNHIPFFGNNLKRRLDSKGIIEVHQLMAKIHALFTLNIVSHRHAALGTMGPEPDERHSRDALSLHREQQKRFTNTLHRSIDRPVRERVILPISGVKSLDSPPHRHGGKRSQKIVCSSKNPAALTNVDISLQPQVIDNFVWVERQIYGTVVDDNVAEGIVSHGPGNRGCISLPDAAITGNIRGKFKIGANEGQILG